MKFLRVLGWVLFLGGAGIIFFLVDGIPTTTPLGWVGLGAMMAGALCTIISTIIRFWPRVDKTV
jgi:hypothetical protein